MKLEQGTILYTKDGRKIGNAVIIQIENSPAIPELGILATIMTDFGNVATLTTREIEGVFYIGPTRCLKGRLRAQRDLIRYPNLLDEVIK